MIEAPLDVQKSITIPPDHLAACAAGGVPTAGNAAGNTVNLLDLSGLPSPPGPLPPGYVSNPPSFLPVPPPLPSSPSSPELLLSGLAMCFQGC